MRDHEVAKIRKFGSVLNERTVCDDTLLLILQQREILGLDDIRRIDSAGDQEGKVGRARQFYQIMQKKDDAFQPLISALYATGQYEVGTILEEGVVPPAYDPQPYAQVPSSSSTKPLKLTQKNRGIQFGIKPPVAMFTGRRDELDELHLKVVENKRNPGAKCVFVSGLGGIGKTELLRQYIVEHIEDFKHNVIWFTASDDASLEESFRRLCATNLGIPTEYANGKKKDIHTVVGQVYKFFQGTKCLFVFDNGDQHSWFKKYLPTGPAALNPFIIVTSRTRKWRKSPSEIILSELKREEAVDMVKDGLGIEIGDTTSHAEIEKLCSTLHCIPLALRQAISYIFTQQKASPNYTIQDYLSQFESDSQQLLGFKDDNYYSKTTVTVWKETMDVIRQIEFGSLAVKILEQMAYYAPDKIPRKLFHQMDTTGGKAPSTSMLTFTEYEDTNEAVHLLYRHFMLNKEDDPNKFSVPRLLQQVVRLVLEAEDREEQVLDNVLSNLFKAALPRGDILDHAKTAAKHALKFPSLIEKHSNLFEKVPAAVPKKTQDESLHTLLYLGSLNRRIGNVEEALRYHQKIFKKRVKALNGNEKNELVQHAKQSIAEDLSTMGKYEQAVPIFEEVIETLNKMHDENYYQVIECEISYARCLIAKGDKLEAAYILFQVQRKLGTEKTERASVVKELFKSLKS